MNRELNGSEAQPMEWCQPLFLQLLQVAERLTADRRFRCRVWSHSVAEKLPLDGYALGIECRHRRRRKPSRLRLEIRVAQANTQPRLLYAGIYWGGERRDGLRLAPAGPLCVEQICARFPKALRKFEQAARHWDPMNFPGCSVSVTLTGPKQPEIGPEPPDQELLRCALQAQGWLSLVMIPWPYPYISPPEALPGEGPWREEAYILHSLAGMTLWPKDSRLSTRALYERFPQALGTVQLCPVHYALDSPLALIGLVRYSWTGVGWPSQEIWHLCRRGPDGWVSVDRAEPDPTPGLEQHTANTLARLQQAGVEILEQEHRKKCPFPVRLKVRHRGRDCQLVVSFWRRGNLFSLEPVAFLRVFEADQALAALDLLCPA